MAVNTPCTLELSPFNIFRSIHPHDFRKWNHRSKRKMYPLLQRSPLSIDINYPLIQDSGCFFFFPSC